MMVFSGPPVSSTNKTDRHDIIEILLKVALNTTKQTNKQVKQDKINNNITLTHSGSPTSKRVKKYFNCMGLET